MINKLIKLYNANAELKKHKAEINKYNKAWAKLRKEQQQSKELGK